MGLLGGSGGWVEVADGWMVALGTDGGGEGGGGSFVRETAGAGVVVESGFVDLRGVLRGDLKGWDRVSAEVFRRRRFEGWMGDIIESKIKARWGGGIKSVFAVKKGGIDANDALRVSTSLPTSHLFTDNHKRHSLATSFSNYYCSIVLSASIKKRFWDLTQDTPVRQPSLKSIPLPLWHPQQQRHSQPSMQAPQYPEPVVS